MKLKKVTALLLATSMVLSSVSVASFADELIFEDEVVVAEDNSEEEASFDDVVFDDAAEEEADYAEDVFEDEVVEDVVDDAVAAYDEEVVEDPVVDDSNADIYEALANAEVVEDVVVEDVVDGETVTDEADYAKTAVTATLKDTTFKYDPTNTFGYATTPSFNYVGSTSDLTYGGTWADSVTYTNQATGEEITKDKAKSPWQLVPGTYKVTFDTSLFSDSTTYKVTVTDSTITVEKATLYAVMPTMASIMYGADAPTATLKAENLSYYKDKAAGTPATTAETSGIIGTPVFETDYKKGDKVGYYNATYVNGLSSDYFEVLPATNCKKQFQVKKATVTVVPQNLTVEYGATPVEPKYTLKDPSATQDYDAAKVLSNEIAAGKATLTIYVKNSAGTGKETKFEPGKYYYGCELDAASTANFTVSVETSPVHTYTVKDVTVTFADYEGVYDGMAHGIIVTPDPSTLPSTVAIWYNSKNSKDPAQGAIKNSQASFEQVDVTTDGPVSVYYFVEQGGKQTDFGYKTITILPAGEDYKAVEAKIDALPAAADATAATKPAADEAKAAYDALPEAQKALIPEEKVKKLNDVKAAADAAYEKEEADKKAAKAVEDQIDALPAAAEATAADKDAADAAKEAYDALTDDQKALVPSDKVQKMNDVKAAADKAAEEAAKKEAEEFNKDVEDVKATTNGKNGKAAAEEAKEAYEALSDEAKALLTDEEKAAYEATQAAYEEGYEFVAGSGKNYTKATYKVLGNGEVAYKGPVSDGSATYVVPNKIKHNGFTYRVWRISNYAFKDCSSAVKISVGKNVRTLGKRSFNKTTALERLTVLTEKLNKVDTDAFKASGKDDGAKLTVVVPTGKTSKYQKLFTSAGMSSEATFTEADEW